MRVLVGYLFLYTTSLYEENTSFDSLSIDITDANHIETETELNLSAASLVQIENVNVAVNYRRADAIGHYSREWYDR
jgi:hypothetical protein